MSLSQPGPRARRRLVLAAVGILASAMSGCILAPMQTRHARAGRVVEAASGAPVAGAEVAVHTRKMGFGYCGEPERSYVTRTDADGRWRVPARHGLRFLVAIPDAGYRYADRYEARAPNGGTVTGGE